jgi:hypothetical protein
MRRTALALLLLITADPAWAVRLPVPPMPPRPGPAALPTPPIPPRPPIRRTGLLRPIPRSSPHHPLTAQAMPAQPALQPAPLPDLDKFPPPRVRLPVEAAPAVFWPLPDMRGDGFIPGSNHQTEIEQPSAAVPGVKITMPLD